MGADGCFTVNVLTQLPRVWCFLVNMLFWGMYHAMADNDLMAIMGPFGSDSGHAGAQRVGIHDARVHRLAIRFGLDAEVTEAVETAFGGTVENVPIPQAACAVQPMEAEPMPPS